MSYYEELIDTVDTNPGLMNIKSHWQIVSRTTLLAYGHWKTSAYSCKSYYDF